jgi:hypothetical protein
MEEDSFMASGRMVCAMVTVLKHLIAMENIVANSNILSTAMDQDAPDMDT